jgi:hypothetical protein
MVATSGEPEEQNSAYRLARATFIEINKINQKPQLLTSGAKCSLNAGH